MKNEFLFTNSSGSYCSADCMLGNTRKYHGLLVVSDPDIKRKVILSRLEEKISFDGDKEEYLNTNIYKDNTITPDGSKNLINKNLSNTLKQEYLIGDIKILKETQLLKNSNQVLISYKVNSPLLTNLKITPFLTNRSFHELSHFGRSPFKLEKQDNTEITIKLSDTEKLQIFSSKFRFFEKNIVYRDFYYPIEQQRGYECTEDLVYFGTMVFDIYPNFETTINILFNYVSEFSQAQIPFSNYKSYVPEFPEIVNSDTPKHEKLKDFIKRGSESFVVQTSKRLSVIAGYHWFEDWGRDTFISFRGLLIVEKQFDKAKKLLLDWSKYINHGLIPNRPGLEEYNSIDATLWYINSLYEYYITTQDGETLHKILPYIKDTLTQFKKGTLYGIHVDEKGFLVSEDESKALTWMDAVFDSKPFTPRIKAAVEIQMLWFNALNIFKLLTKHNEDKYYDQELTEKYIDENIEKLKENFESTFWNDDKNFANDFVNGEYKNEQIRPNVVLGLHLPFHVLSNDKSLKTLETIHNKLITPIGLKTLDPQDTEYCADYCGDQFQRDKSYHNGTVWPWIYGFYLKSYLIQHNYSEEARSYVIERLSVMWDFIDENKLNYLPEIFSAQNLAPDGCISQAWNYGAFMEVFDMLENR